MAPRNFLRSVLLALAALAAASAFAEPVVVERESTIHAKPDTNAPVVATLKRGTTGDATTRQGPFVNLKTSAGSGWILSFNVRYGGASSGAVDVSGVGSRVVGPQQKLNVTSTIGIRGIEKEDLQKAQFDAQQLAQLEKYRASDAAAKSAAAGHGLRATEIKYLDK
jgi:hypothetical protein